MERRRDKGEGVGVCERKRGREDYRSNAGEWKKRNELMREKEEGMNLIHELVFALWTGSQGNH